MIQLLLIFAGAGTGGVARYALSEWISRSGGTFPFGTLAVNVLGCAVMGVLHTSLEGSSMRESYRLAIFVGLLGGFTTFSAFSRETLVLLEDRHWWLALANVMLTNALCLGGAWIGMRAGERWAPA